MDRYWVNLGDWETIKDALEKSEDIEDKKLMEKIEEASGKLECLATGVSGDMFPSLVYKTNDLDDAKRVCREAEEIILKIFDEEADLYLTELTIVRQPKCPKCGVLSRFSDFYCSRCGTKLIPKEDIEMDLKK